MSLELDGHLIETLEPGAMLEVLALPNMAEPMNRRAPRATPTPEATRPLRLSDQLEGWLTDEGQKTFGSLVHTFGDKSFAILLVLLLGAPRCRCRPVASRMCSS